jgi:hypothetical protein
MARRVWAESRLPTYTSRVVETTDYWSDRRFTYLLTQPLSDIISYRLMILHGEYDRLILTPIRQRAIQAGNYMFT